MSTTKKLKTLVFLLIAALSFTACKKDALEVKTEKTFVSATSTPATDLAGGRTELTLKPGGSASILPGGDILWNGTYKISGKKITVYVQQSDEKYRFTIISDTEIHSEYGEVLKLVNL